MFKIGDKAKGFKFNGGTDGVHYDNEMDDYVGVVGEVAEIYSDSFVIMFPDHLEWMYPASLWNLAKVEETQPFKIGDRVKFKKSSIDSGMIDATEDDVFMVVHINSSREVQIWITGYTGWWNIDHFEHVKESAMTNADDAMNNAEEQEIKWEVGQEVWDVRYGKGIVDTLLAIPCQYPIGVVFADGGTASYTSKGLNRCTDVYRSLFFSEPKIEAELFPPKKPFTPTLKRGDTVVVEWAGTVQVLTLSEETERQVRGTCGQVWDKDPDVHFYKLSEEIKFN